jgi:hypothetical protein
VVSSRLDARAKRSPRGGDRERDLRERSPPPKRDSTPPSRSRSSRRPPSPSFRGRARSCSSRPRPPSLIASFPNRSPPPPPPPRRTVRPSISPPSIRAIARSRSPSLANPTLAKYVRVAFDARARPSLALPFVARASLVTVALAALNISLTCAADVRALSGPTSAYTNRIVSGDVVAGAARVAPSPRRRVVSKPSARRQSIKLIALLVLSRFADALRGARDRSRAS